MARVSKYQSFEGQSFNIKGLDVQVMRYHREVRTSQKSGKKYYVYRLDVQLQGYTDILEISTTSWNKQSFIKRLQKTSVNKVVDNVFTVVDDETFNWDLDRFSPLDEPSQIYGLSTVYVDDYDRVIFDYDVLASIAVNLNLISEKPSTSIQPKTWESVVYDKFTDVYINQQIEYWYQKIDNNNETRQQILNQEHSQELIDEGKRNGFNDVKDHINWYFDKENMECVKGIEMFKTDINHYRLSYNIQAYLKEVAEDFGYQAMTKAYKHLAKQYHPDMGGSDSDMQTLIKAKELVEEDYIEQLKKVYKMITSFIDDCNESGITLDIRSQLEDWEYNDMVRFGIVA